MILRELIENYVPRCEQEEADRRVQLMCLDTFPNILSRENELAHFTASSWIADPRRERVLMVWHNIYRHWSWTGGHADGDPDLLAVALREASEETGVTGLKVVSDGLYSLENLNVLPHIKRGRYVPAHLHLNLTWLFEADDTLPLTVKPDENSGVKWFPIDEVIAAADEPEMTPVYTKLNERLKAR